MVQALGNYTYPFSGNKANIQSYSNLKFANTVDIDGTTNDNPRETVGNVDKICIRMSEVLLMKAEAQSGTGDPKATLNLLLAARTRAGEPTMTCDNYASMAGITPLQMVQFRPASKCGVKKVWNTTTTNVGVSPLTVPAQKFTGAKEPIRFRA